MRKIMTHHDVQSEWCFFFPIQYPNISEHQHMTYIWHILFEQMWKLPNGWHTLNVCLSGFKPAPIHRDRLGVGSINTEEGSDATLSCGPGGNIGYILNEVKYPTGSMVLLYMVTWIPSIYPIHVSIYTIHGSYGYGRTAKHEVLGITGQNGQSNSIDGIRLNQFT